MTIRKCENYHFNTKKENRNETYIQQIHNYNLNSVPDMVIIGNQNKMVKKKKKF